MTARILIAFDPADGETTEVVPTADSFSINSISLVGASPDLNGLPSTPPTASSAASKSYVDGLINGRDWKESVRLATAAALPANTAAGSGAGKTLTADANGALTVDGVAVDQDDRILVKNEATATDNGIYVVTATGDGSNPYVLTRATDADEDSEVTAQLTVAAEEGTANADTGWQLSTDDPITVDTTSLTFIKVISEVISAGAGLLQTGAVFDVELDIDADAQSTGADGGSSGLEFDASGVAGQLRVAVDPDAGLQRDAAGIGILLDGTTLSTSAAGAKVDHSPKLQDSYILGEAIAQYDPVCWGAANDKLAKGDAGITTDSRVMGVLATAGVLDDVRPVVSHGIVTGALTALGPTAGDPIYLADSGGLTDTLPTGDVNRVRVGYAKSADDLWVEIEFLGRVGAPA